MDFNGEMKRAAPPDKLRGIWQKVLDQIGPFEDTGETRSRHAMGTGSQSARPGLPAGT